MNESRVTVLVVDDEPSLLRMLKLQLRADGHHVLTAGSGEEAMGLFAQHGADVVLLDIILPDTSGFDVLREIKARSRVPVILMSARSGNDIHLQALAAGADDFISKPFSPGRITSAVNALISRKQGGTPDGEIVHAAGLAIDLARRTVTRDGERIALSGSEWRLLEQLARVPGEPVLHQELLTRVWGPEYQGDVDYLRIWIDRLRGRLGDDAASPRIIRPFLDVGYTLNGRRA